MKVYMVISYDGSKFSGFQIQTKTKNTVAQKLKDALISLGINSKFQASGRTDSGVHATYQVISLEIPLFWQKKGLAKLKKELNKKLKYIVIKYIKKVDLNFHAQYSAKTRVYRYLIKTTAIKPFEQDYVSFYEIKDFNLFKKALNLYLGEHNFKFFKKEGSFTSSDIRVIKKIKVIKIKNYIAIYIYANGFLRSQVRMLIKGALLVENKKISINNLKEQINCEKKYFSSLAKPQGLYLARVYY